MDIAAQITFLEGIFEDDQHERLQLSDELTSQEREKLGRAIQKRDETNREKIITFIDDHGWPMQSKHGVKATSAAFLVIQHSALELIEKYYPILQEKAEAGEASPVDAAMMLDRMLMYRCNLQKYGSQASIGKDGKMYIWPIENSKNIDQRRQELGFESGIEEYARNLGATYNPMLKISDMRGFD